MQFIVIGLDGTDKEAPQRRAKARQAHIDMGEELRQSGNMWYGAALLHDDGSMKGSMILVDFPSVKELQAWLDKEPYVVGDVWRDITIHKSNTRDPWQFNRPKEWFEEHAQLEHSSTPGKGDIHKAAGIIIVDRKVLVERSQGKDYFIHPGGKIEQGETAKQALVRELKEEFQIDVSEEDLELFDKSSAPAANSPEVNVHMETYMVKKWQGNIQPDSEVEEIRWLTSDVPRDIQIGSIMEHVTIPKLKAGNYID